MNDAFACNIGLLGTDAESANGEVSSFAVSGGDVVGVITAPVDVVLKGVAVSGGSNGLSMGDSVRDIGENAVSEDAVRGLRSMASSGRASSELRMLSGLWFPEPPPFEARLERRP